MPERSPRLPFEIDDAIDPTLVTGRAGVPLVIELFRQLGVAQETDTHVTVKQRQRGLPPSHRVENLIVLWATGADRCQDLVTLREDQAFATMLGHPLPAATTMRDFLEAFHVEHGPLWTARPEAAIPLESAPVVRKNVVRPVTQLAQRDHFRRRNLARRTVGTAGRKRVDGAHHAPDRLSNRAPLFLVSGSSLAAPSGAETPFSV